MFREEGEAKQWNCARAGATNLKRVGSMVLDIGEPCLSQPHIKVNRMLKPDKWQAFFDSFGTVFGFQKALKLIILGGVDPSIRPEVWEFLLGCYRIGSTAEYRQQLRTTRRQKYQDLIKECQSMHSSVGTGTLAYIVGSKVMDVRTASNDYTVFNDEIKRSEASEGATNREANYMVWNSNCTEIPSVGDEDGCGDSTELVSVRRSAGSEEYDTTWFLPVGNSYNSSPVKVEEEASHPDTSEDKFFEFPALPVTNLFSKTEDKKAFIASVETPAYEGLSFENSMHTFQIANNVDLIIESRDCQSSTVVSHHNKSDHKIVNCIGSIPSCCQNSDTVKGPHILSYEVEMDRLKASDVPEMTLATSSDGRTGQGRKSEWLWTLHRIVVDVVRTDSNLEFYEDKRNIARMSDILAVYAWVDPATGYCQGMSDLLSPFVVLFEDDADAFWCFEMLLRRMRENFQMEGPTGVMKQLQTLWHILEFTDKEMFVHISRIGAESLHFAFRMLMVLFRRELSFNDSLCMWEMMWAADFDESEAFDLDDICLEALILDLPKDSKSNLNENVDDDDDCSKESLSGQNVNNAQCSPNEMRSSSTHALCGLTRNFWSRSDFMPVNKIVSSAKNGDEDLSIFCVAAILILNRQKLIRETRSIDDMIKIFNDKLLKIHVRRSIRTAIKLRKKYFYKIMRNKTPASQNVNDLPTP